MISIVITFYNGAKFAAQCVDSILNQNFDDIHVVLVDDASTDGTLSILRNYEEQYKRVSVITNSINGGVSNARYNGFLASPEESEYVMFLDGDDVLCGGALSHLSKIARERESDIVIGKCIFSENPERDSKLVFKTNSDEGSEKTGSENKNSKYSVKDAEDIESLYLEDDFDNMLVGKLYKTSFLKRLNVEKNKERCPFMFFEDYMCTVWFFDQAKSITLTDRNIWCHRERPGSVSHDSKLIGWHFDHIEAGKYVLRYTDKRNLNRIRRKELTRYISIIGRIYCLLEINPISPDDKVAYEKRILKEARKVFNDYKTYGSDSGFRKAFFRLFITKPKLWRKIVLNTYYRSYHQVSG